MLLLEKYYELKLRAGTVRLRLGYVYLVVRGGRGASQQ